MRTIISIALSFALLTPAFAAPISMVCQNPRQEYLAVFDPDAKTFVINPDTKMAQYHVLKVEFLGVVSGEADRGSNLDFTARFFAPSRIQFSVAGEVVQTDKCRDTQLYSPDNTPMDIGIGN